MKVVRTVGQMFGQLREATQWIIAQVQMEKSTKFPQILWNDALKIVLRESEYL